MRICCCLTTILLVLHSTELVDHAQALEGNTTCESTYFGEPASVTCTFNEDVSKSATHTGVRLLKYNLRNTTQIPETVIDCYWFEEGDLECAVSSGYEFNKVITDRMTVSISSAKPEHEGRYKCQVVPPNGVTICDLIPKGKTTTPRSTTESRKKFTDAKASRDTGPDLTVQTTRDPVLYAVAAVILIQLLIVAAVVVFFVCRWFRPRKRRERMKNDYSLVPTHKVEPHGMTREPPTQEISRRPNLPTEIVTHPQNSSEIPTTFTLTTENRKHTYKVQMLEIVPSYRPIYAQGDNVMDPSWQYASGASEDQVLELDWATFGD